MNQIVFNEGVLTADDVEKLQAKFQWPRPVDPQPSPFDKGFTAVCLAVANFHAGMRVWDAMALVTGNLNELTFAGNLSLDLRRRLLSAISTIIEKLFD